MGWKLKREGESYSLESIGINKEMIKYYRWKKKHIDERPKLLMAELCGHLLLAIESKNGAFFKDLARLCEYGKGNLNLRGWLVVVHFNWIGNTVQQDEFFTADELCKMAVERRIVKEITERDMRRICKEIGIKIKPRRKLRRISN